MLSTLDLRPSAPGTARTLLAALAVLAFPLTTALARTEGTLSLVSEGSYNKFNVTVSASGASDTETTTATGTVSAWFDADPATGATTALALTGGSIALSDVHLQLKILWVITVADLNSSGMGGTAFTAAPPTTVTPTANGGTFDAAGERLRIDRGTLSGTAAGQAVNVDFSQSPIEGAGSGTGSVALSNRVGATHTATLIVPVDFSTTQDMSGTMVTVRVQGTLKAVGTVSSLRTWGGGAGNWTNVNWTPGPVSGSTLGGFDAAIPTGTVNVNAAGLDAVHSITLGSGGRLNTYNSYNGVNTYQAFANLVLQGGAFQGSGSNNVWGAAKLVAVTAGGSAASVVSAASWFDLDTTTTFTVADATGSSATDLTVSAQLRDLPTGTNTRTASALVKAGAGTMVLSGLNTYTGNTRVNGGTLVLADNARLKFAVGANGVSNKVTGTGAATFAGDFTLDLAGADPAPGNRWTLVDVAKRSFGPTFTLVGFTKKDGVHTMTDAANRLWTFAESTGILAVAEAGYGSWVNRYPGLPADQRDPGDDWDADRLTNLLEYVLGGSPLAADAAAIAPTATRDELGNIVLVFERSDLSETDTTLVVQHGDDLAGWTDLAVHPAPAGAGVVVAEDVPTAELDTVTVTIPTGGAPGYFVRLRVAKP